MNSSEETDSSIDELPDKSMTYEDRIFLDRVQKYWLPNELGREGPSHFVTEFGRFQILDCLGRGGFGIVYLARDPILACEVALKIPIIESVTKTNTGERFLVEIHAIASLQHEYIVPLLDAGEVDGVAYLAMRYCPMGTLANWLRRQESPVEPRVAAALVRALCSAVGHAHDQGIVHRDLKPANVLLTEAPADSNLSRFGLDFNPLVADFGMAKILGWDESDVKMDQLTRTGTRMGTPCYMPPEHATGRAKESAPTSDVYALGVILYEILLGHPPFTGRSEYDVLHKVVSKDPPRMRKYRSEIPGPLEYICLKCLEKEPSRRYRDANKLGDDLTRFLEGKRLANQPLIERATFKKLTQSILLVCLAILMVALIWIRPQLRFNSSSVDNKVDTVSIGSEGSAIDYATAIEKALPNAAGTVDEMARLYLDNPEFMKKHSDDLAFEWRFARQRIKDDHFRASHAGESWALAYSPDGRWMAENSNESHVNLWDAESESLVKRLQGHFLSTYALAFSPNKKFLATAERQHSVSQEGRVYGVQIWDLERLVPMWENGSHIDLNRVSGLSFSSQGPWIYVYGSDLGYKSAIWKCHIETAEIAWKWSSSGAFVHAIAESDQDGLISIVQEEFIDEEPSVSFLSLNPASMEAAEIMPRLAISLRYAKFSESGSLLVLGECDKSDEVRDVAQAELNAIQADKVLRLHLFDVAARENVGKFEEPGGCFEAICFERATNHFYVVCATSLETVATRVLRRWDADKKQFFWVRTIAPGPRTNSMTMHPLTDTLVLRRFLDSRIYFLELDRNCIQEIEGHYPKEAWSVSFSEDGSRILTGGDDGLARVWDTISGRLLDQYDAHVPKLVTDASFVPGFPNRVVTGSYDKTAHIWSVYSKERSVFNLPHESLVRGLALSSDGSSLLTVADDFFVRCWNIENGELRWKSPTGIRKLKGICLNPSGKEVAVVGNDGTLRTLSVQDGSSISRAESSSSEIWSVVYSPWEKTWLASTNAGVIEKFNGEESKLEPWGLSSSGIRVITISPDGRTLVSANTLGEIELWQVSTRRLVGLLDRVDQPIYDLSFSPDGQRLAAALHDGSIRIWVAPHR